MIPLPRNRRRRKARRAYSRAVRSPAPAVLPKPVAEVEPPAALAYTRREMMAQLDELGAPYNPRANHAALTAALWAAKMSADG